MAEEKINPEVQESEKKPSFDDFLKDSANQSEFDKRIAKALETAKGKWENEANEKIKSAKEEAEKLAAMNAEQKAEYESEKRETELAAREAKLNKRELIAEAKNILTEKGLPLSLVDTLDFTNAEACNNSITKIETTFNDALATAVANKVRGKSDPPKKSGEGEGGEITKEQFDKMGYKARLDLYNNNKALYDELTK